MGLYVWKRPAWFSFNIVDHTWVTDYDLQTSHSNSPNKYWFCKGGLYTEGEKIVANATPAQSAACLVKANDPTAKGTIRYGIDGVCHQIANQVIYATGKILAKDDVRGYRFSHCIFGTYGRREQLWDEKLQDCGLPAMTLQQKMEARSFLHRRAKSLFGFGSDIPAALKNARRRLLYDIDAIGLRFSIENETPADRATELNRRITAFLNEAASVMEKQNQQHYFEELFGFQVGTEITLIDPDLFEFAE